ncbi:hypothetical protein ACFSQ7_51135 [Paenibacillus rhizoplanae]
MYPMSLQAASVPGVFKLALEDRNVPVYYKHKVLNVTVSAGHPRFAITCQTETEEQVVYTSDYLFFYVQAALPLQKNWNRRLRLYACPTSGAHHDPPGAGHCAIEAGLSVFEGTVGHQI